VVTLDADRDYAKLVSSVDHTHPTTVVLLPHLGPTWNIRRNRFVPDLEAAVAAFKKMPGHPNVLIATPLPVSGSDLKAQLVAEELEPLTRQAARETKTELFDTGALFEGTADLMSGSALTEDGAALLADQLAQALAPKAVKSKWQVVQFSSEQAGEGPASAAIDGDPATYWHTQYDPKPAKAPHSITIDFGEPLRLIGATYLPRQDGGSNGIAKGYEIYVGDSLSDFGAPVAVGKFPAGSGVKLVRWPTQAVGRFMKFVITSEQTGGTYGSAAEIGIMRLANK
jgi:hypothetical protein